MKSRLRGGSRHGQTMVVPDDAMMLVFPSGNLTEEEAKNPDNYERYESSQFDHTCFELMDASYKIRWSGSL